MHGRYLYLGLTPAYFTWTYVTLDKWSCFNNCNQKGINIVFMSCKKKIRLLTAGNRFWLVKVKTVSTIHIFSGSVWQIFCAKKKIKLKKKSNNKNSKRYLPFNMNTTICHILKIMRFTWKIQLMGNKSQIKSEPKYLISPIFPSP